MRHVTAKKLMECIESGDALEYKNLVVKMMNEDLDDELPDVIGALPVGSINPDADNEVDDAVADQDQGAAGDASAVDGASDDDDLPDDPAAKEAAIVSKVEQVASSMGASDCSYSDGVIDVSIPTLDLAKTFSAFLDSYAPVETYDIDGVAVDPSAGADTAIDSTELTSVGPDDFVCFEFFVYIDPSLVVDDAVPAPDGVVAIENGSITERVHRLRTVFAEEAQVIQCDPGYCYDPETNACVKKTEEEVQADRDAIRDAAADKQSDTLGEAVKHVVVKKKASAKNRLSIARRGLK